MLIFLKQKWRKCRPPVVHIPTCMGAVVMAYNLPEVKELQLTGDMIADIFLGKITRWNDPRIQQVNPGVTLPDKAVSPVYRSDGSGTTYVFSDYLTKISAPWAENIGTGKSIEMAGRYCRQGKSRRSRDNQSNSGGRSVISVRNTLLP